MKHLDKLVELKVNRWKWYTFGIGIIAFIFIIWSVTKSLLLLVLGNLLITTAVFYVGLVLGRQYQFPSSLAQIKQKIQDESGIDFIDSKHQSLKYGTGLYLIEITEKYTTYIVREIAPNKWDIDSHVTGLLDKAIKYIEDNNLYHESEKSRQKRLEEEREEMQDIREDLG